MVKNPLVSVIIPTKNSEETIGKCLESIKNQTYYNIEVIVVDGFSKDGTKKIAESHSLNVIQSNAARSKARNIGAGKARGRLVLFVDSDMELESSVVNECVMKIKEGYDGIIIPEVSVGEGFWARCKALEKVCYIGDDTIEAARFFKKHVFDRVGGYDLELEAGEDWDLSHRVKRAGYNIRRATAFIKHNEGKLSLQKTILKKYRYGKTLRSYRTKNPEEAKQQSMLIRPAFLRNWRALTRDPSLTLGMFLMKACEFFAIGVGALG
jgi:glycosyltransferase involved in cell wall biosynthesis